MQPIKKTPQQFANGEIGIYENIPFDDYKALVAVNASSLKLMERSPLHFRYNYLNPRKDSEALSLGRVAHACIFEPDKFKNYAVAPKTDGRTKEGKGTKAKFLSDNEGREFIDKEEYDISIELRDAVYSNPVAKIILEKEGYHELTLVWNDVVTGVLCKARLDRYTNFVYSGVAEPVIIDLKTCQDARALPFSRDILKYKYYFSMCFYMKGLQTLLGVPHRRSILIAVETPRPHGVLLQQLSSDWIDAGMKEVEKHLATFKLCNETNEWSGYAQEIINSVPPPYSFTEN